MARRRQPELRAATQPPYYGTNSESVTAAGEIRMLKLYSCYNRRPPFKLAAGTVT